MFFLSKHPIIFFFFYSFLQEQYCGKYIIDHTIALDLKTFIVLLFGCFVRRNKKKKIKTGSLIDLF